MTVVERQSTNQQLDPISTAVRLRPVQREGTKERFEASDPPRGMDLLARSPRLARLVKSRRFQFLLILPNQIVFWTVIFVGLVGTADPGLNFATAITWYVWFCLVFVMMVAVGRAWCAMCPFGGFAEWVQRRSFWQRTQKSLGLGLKFPPQLARLGFMIPVVSFLVLTYIEEYFNIAGPGAPADTSWMVVGIVASALIFFLVFERRTFCRYICPLTTLTGSVGSMGAVAGFRTRDREVCLSCTTKDCMRGGEDGYGCPWYTWPGSADSNLSCGLCSECYKSCPSENVGLFIQKPLTSVIAPRRRRFDVALGVAFLWGLVLYQQINATSLYGSLDDWLNKNLRFPHYPDPIAYLGLIAAGAAIMMALAWVASSVLGRRDLKLAGPENFIDRKSRFRAYFTPMLYGLIPVIGADYFARQLPKFFQYSPRVITAVEHLGGYSSAKSPIYNFSLLNNGWIVVAQIAVIAFGTLAAAWSTWKIAGKELVPVSRNALAARATSLAVVLATGTAAAFLYLIMHAAD